MTANSNQNSKERFAGNPHLSGSGLALYTILGGGLIAFIILIPHALFAFFIFVAPILYFAFGSELYYFIVTEHSIAVKNHVFFWVEHEYTWQELHSVEFIQPGKRALALRLYPRDRRSRKFCAETLDTRQWKELIAKMRLHNIRILDIHDFFYH